MSVFIKALLVNQCDFKFSPYLYNRSQLPTEPYIEKVLQNEMQCLIGMI